MKYSKYYKRMMVASVIMALIAGLSMVVNHPGLSAVLFVVTFVIWFAGVMAPDYEKYESE
jgi:hypothetical protein